MSRSLPHYLPHVSHHWAGFSLIEMLVAITIMMVLVGAGMAAFLTFSDRQNLVQAAKTVQAHMRSAQVKARAGDTPENCQRLEGYSVRMSAGSNRVRLLAICENGEYLYDRYDLPLSVTAQSGVDIEFLGLYGGVNNPSTVTLVSQDWQYAFDVTKGGEITEGNLVEQ